MRGEGEGGTECGRLRKGTLQEKEGSGGMGREQRGVEGAQISALLGAGVD